MSIRHVETYACEDDEGAQYEVYVWQRFKMYRPLNGPSSEVPGMKDLRLSNGRHVTPIDERTFKIVDNDVVLRRVD